MDSGLGSDDERRHRTKEQKQQQNQQRQLFSSCFIDASSLGDESDQDIPSNDERSQGSLIFQNSIKQYSMLQMDHPRALFCGSTSSLSAETQVQNEPSTPFNSIVQVDNDNSDACHRTPVGFFVDLNSIEEPPSLTKETKEKQKNLFSLVIDFKEPKREMPTKLSDSLYNRNKAKKKNSKQEKGSVSSKTVTKDSSSRKSSTSSLPININDIYTERITDTETASLPCKNTDQYNATCSHDNKVSLSIKKKNSDNNTSSSSSSSNCESKSNTSANNINLTDDSSSNSLDLFDTNSKENAPIDLVELNKPKNSLDCDLICAKPTVVEKKSLPTIIENRKIFNEVNFNENKKVFKDSRPMKNEDVHLSKDQFVKLSDLQKQLPRLDLTPGPRMIHSIPESSWVESPLSLSRSATYRSAPPRPLEPELCELSDSGSFSDVSISQTTGRSVQRLGTDLLRMFLEEIGPDVTIEVGTYRLRAHKCILSSRCQYFAAVLGGNWLEASGNVIALHGYSYDSVHFAMCHIYSGAAHVPESINLAELAALADMLGLEGLKEVAAHALKVRYCHSFHKPCSGCCTGVLEILPLAAAYSLEDLYHKCLRWITQNFVRIWPTRAFVALSKELQEKCYKQHVVHMHPDGVLSTILKCQELSNTIPKARWTDPVTRLVKQLSMSCQLYLSQHFTEVLSSSAISDLNCQHSVNTCVLEEKMVEAAKTLGPDHACSSYDRCSKLLETRSWNPKIQELLQKIQTNLEHCLSRQMSRVSQCHAWSKMNPALKVRIKELSRLPRPIRNGSPVIKSPRIAGKFLKSDSPERYNPEHAKLTSAINLSIRKSLLLAAKTPQMSASLYAPRTSSTLTKPTQSSAAKAASAKSSNLKSSLSKQSFTSTLNPPTKSSRPSSEKQPPKNSYGVNNRPRTVETVPKTVPKSPLKTLSKSETKVQSRPVRPGLYAPKNRNLNADKKTKANAVETGPKKTTTATTTRVQQEIRRTVPRVGSARIDSSSTNKREKRTMESVKKKKTELPTVAIQNVSIDEKMCNGNASSSEENTYTKSSENRDGDGGSVPRITRSDTFLKEKPTILSQTNNS